MDALIDFLTQWGYLGMFLSALLAGTIVPFSSEAVLIALVHPSTGLDPVGCILAATLGNMLGSLTCYWLGHLGKMEWLVKYFHMSQQRIENMQNYLHKKSAFMAFFAFIPVIGSVIAVALGFLRSDLKIVTVCMLAGKLLRYVAVVLAARGIFNFFL